MKVKSVSLSLLAAAADRDSISADRRARRTMVMSGRDAAALEPSSVEASSTTFAPVEQQLQETLPKHRPPPSPRPIHRHSTDGTPTSLNQVGRTLYFYHFVFKTIV